MSAHNRGNHESTQQFDEIVSTQQKWQFVTLGYFTPRACVPTPTTIYNGLQNQPPNPNISLVTIDLEME